MAKRRLRHAEAGSRAGEAAFFGNREKSIQIDEIVPAHS
jgi:hypothetical protein